MPNTDKFVRNPKSGMYGDTNGDGEITEADGWHGRELEEAQEYNAQMTSPPKSDGPRPGGEELDPPTVDDGGGNLNNSTNIDRPWFINRVTHNWVPPILRERQTDNRKIYFRTDLPPSNEKVYYRVVVLCGDMETSNRVGVKITKKFNLTTATQYGDNHDSVEVMHNFNIKDLNKFKRLLKSNNIRYKLDITKHTI